MSVAEMVALRTNLDFRIIKRIQCFMMFFK